MSADTALLAVIAALEAFRAVQEWRVDRALLEEAKPLDIPAAAAPATEATPAPAPAFTEEDYRIEALIHDVDPLWSLGESRDHIRLVPDEDGRIVKAVLA